MSLCHAYVCLPCHKGKAIAKEEVVEEAEDVLKEERAKFVVVVVVEETK